MSPPTPPPIAPLNSADEDSKVTGWPGSEAGGWDGDQVFINLISAADLSARPGPCQLHTHVTGMAKG